MLTQQERIKIRQVIEQKIAKTNEAVMQSEHSRSTDALMFIPGNTTKDIETLLRQYKVKLALLQQALVTVNHDWYGKCNRCGNPIPFNKLVAAPELTKCPNCL